jgi:glycosyltransferase involved in cell wall biosynthesis
MPSQPLNTSSVEALPSKFVEMPDRPLLSIVMPVFNEAATVAEVIDAVLAVELPVDRELIIVESNSTDTSREIVSRYADHPNVRLILQDKPRGKGAAVRAGFEVIRGDFILIQDADMEYDVNDYPIVLQPLLDGRATFVLGCRHVRGRPMREFTEARHMSRLLNVAHWGFTGLFDLVYWVRLRDPFTMYKVFRSDCIRGVRFEANRFDFDWELVGKLVRLGHRPLEVKVNYNSRGFEEGKKVRLFRDPLTWMVALVKFRFAPLYDKPKSFRTGKEAVDGLVTAEHDCHLAEGQSDQSMLARHQPPKALHDR